MKNEQFGLVVATIPTNSDRLSTKIKNFIKVENALKNDPVITYNHMQDDPQEKMKPKVNKFNFKNRLTLIFIAEEILIAMLLALIFYMI